MKILLFFLITLFICLDSVGYSEESTAPGITACSGIHVQGKAKIQAKPDRAKILIAMITKSTDPQAAGSENAVKMDRIIKELKESSVSKLEIKNIGYSLNPNYQYPTEGEPKIIGYTAMNTVQVQTDHLTKIGFLIDTAVKAGANQIQSLEYLLKNEEAVQAQALRQAVSNAQNKAHAIAEELGVKFVRVVKVQEQSGVIVPIRSSKTFAAEARQTNVSTPIEPGMIEVTGTVSMNVEIQP